MVLSLARPLCADSESIQVSADARIFAGRMAPLLKAKSRVLSRGNRMLAEELYREGFIEAFSAAARYVSGFGTLDGYAEARAHLRMLHVRRYYLRRQTVEMPDWTEANEHEMPSALIDSGASARLMYRCDSAEVRRLLPLVLTPRESIVVDARYFRSFSKSKTASELKISLQRVAQLEQSALQKLRAALEVKGRN